MIHRRHRKPRRIWFGLKARMAEKLVCSCKHRMAMGSFNGITGNGTASYMPGRGDGWIFERSIIAGQWRGPWRLVRYKRWAPSAAIEGVGHG